MENAPNKKRQLKSVTFSTAGSRTRTGTRSPPVDFESTASAIPPRRHPQGLLLQRNLFYHSHFKMTRIFLNFFYFSKNSLNTAISAPSAERFRYPLQSP